MTPYYIYINQQVTHVSFIIYDRKHNENCNIYMLCSSEVNWTHHNEVSHLEVI
jgi:hypothetical protein